MKCLQRRTTYIIVRERRTWSVFSSRDVCGAKKTFTVLSILILAPLSFFSFASEHKSLAASAVQNHPVRRPITSMPTPTERETAFHAAYFWHASCISISFFIVAALGFDRFRVVINHKDSKTWLVVFVERVLLFLTIDNLNGKMGMWRDRFRAFLPEA